MIHVTMREEEAFWESVDTIQCSVCKVITPDSGKTGESSGKTAHCRGVFGHKTYNLLAIYNFGLLQFSPEMFL